MTSDLDELTERMCRESPRNAALRAILLHHEAAAHESGWDGDWAAPVLSTLVSEPYHLGLGLGVHVNTADVRRWLAQSRDLSEALGTLADIYEKVRAEGDGDEGPPADDEDMLTGPLPGWKIVGYALGWELWEVHAPRDEIPVEMARAKRLYTHPDRIEVRRMMIYTRDGVLWSCRRARGEEPTVRAYPAEYFDLQRGGVPNALSRMLNAVAGEPVPIVPLAPHDLGQPTPPTGDQGEHQGDAEQPPTPAAAAAEPDPQTRTDEQVEQETAQLCADDPLSANVRAALLEQENALNDVGWDNGLRIFDIWREPDGTRIRFAWNASATRNIQLVLRHTSDDAAAALLLYAKLTEDYRRNGLPAELGPDGQPLDPPPADEDMAVGDDGWRFHGLGVVYEAWSVVVDDDVLRRRAVGKSVEGMPHRREIRECEFVGRDGLLWVVHRTRGEQPVATAHPLTGNEVTGDVPHALARLVNAIAAGAPVPVPADGVQAAAGLRA